MKVTFEFTLPEDQSEYEASRDGAQWQRVAYSMDDALRNWLKYGHDLKGANEALEGARAELLRLLDEYGLKLHE